MTEETYPTWDELKAYADEIANYFEGEVDFVAPIIRGGMPLGVYISHQLDAPVRSINANHYEKKKKQGQVDISGMHLAGITSDDTVLVFDDVVDSGDTLRVVKKNMRVMKPIPFDIKTASLHVKPDRNFDPDYFSVETDKWVVYPWEE